MASETPVGKAPESPAIPDKSAKAPAAEASSLQPAPPDINAQVKSARTTKEIDALIKQVNRPVPKETPPAEAPPAEVVTETPAAEETPAETPSSEETPVETPPETPEEEDEIPPTEDGIKALIEDLIREYVVG